MKSFQCAQNAVHFVASLEIRYQMVVTRAKIGEFSSGRGKVKHAHFDRFAQLEPLGVNDNIFGTALPNPSGIVVKRSGVLFKCGFFKKCCGKQLVLNLGAA